VIKLYTHKERTAKKSPQNTSFIFHPPFYSRKISKYYATQ
jgi:hypothetical protein